jgi:hypothetical protein
MPGASGRLPASSAGWRANSVAKQQSIQKLAPAVRVAPLGELRVYMISEDELDALERGSPASIHLNFALAFWSVGLSFLVTLLSTTIQSDRTFVVFVVVCVATSIAASVFTILWFRHHRSSGNLAKRIRDRMTPAPAIQLAPGASTETEAAPSPEAKR